MRFSHLSKMDIDLSQLTVGTWALSGRDNFGHVDRNKAIEAIHKAIELGVNHIDTAPVYGNGYSEQLVGEALQGINREKVYISTKFGLSPNVDSRMIHDASYHAVMREVESSLQNLKTSYIDFYFIHWPDPNTPISETMSALNHLKEIGKIRHIAVSNFTKEQIVEAMKYGDVEVHQPQYSLVNHTNRNLMSWCGDQGIESFTYGSLGSGVLSGKYRELPSFDEKDTRVTFYDYFKEPKFSRIQILLKEMDAIATSHNATCAQVAINWSTQQKCVSTALIGMTKPEEVIENCKAFDWELTENEIAKLNEIVNKEEI